MAGFGVALMDKFMTGFFRPEGQRACPCRKVGVFLLGAYAAYKLVAHLYPRGVPIRAARVVITGGSSGIGAAIGSELARRGAKNVHVRCRKRPLCRGVP